MQFNASKYLLNESQSALKLTIAFSARIFSCVHHKNYWVNQQWRKSNMSARARICLPVPHLSSNGKMGWNSTHTIDIDEKRAAGGRGLLAAAREKTFCNTEIYLVRSVYTCVHTSRVKTHAWSRVLSFLSAIIKDLLVYFVGEIYKIGFNFAAKYSTKASRYFCCMNLCFCLIYFP